LIASRLLALALAQLRGAPLLQGDLSALHSTAWHATSSHSIARHGATLHGARCHSTWHPTGRHSMLHVARCHSTLHPARRHSTELHPLHPHCWSLLVSLLETAEISTATRHIGHWSSGLLKHTSIHATELLLLLLCLSGS
jgi:hypothetical protein